MYHKLKICDVALRDGIQGLRNIYSKSDKLKILNTIQNVYKPQSIEIGALASSKLVPQMKNTIDLWSDVKNTELAKHTNLFVLVSSQKYMKNVIDNHIQNISLLTSVSDEFQRKNVNRSLEESKKEINQILHIKAQKDNSIRYVKLYVSCINTCPIAGKFSSDYIVQELKQYIRLPGIDEICLSDTCGTLTLQEFESIIEPLLIDADPSRISLHLHRKNRYCTQDIYQIIDYAIMKNIYKFDVSYLENTGGCHMTLSEGCLPNNLHYNDFDHKNNPYITYL